MLFFSLYFSFEMLLLHMRLLICYKNEFMYSIITGSYYPVL